MISDVLFIYFSFKMHWIAFQIISFTKCMFCHRDMNLVFQQFIKKFSPFFLLPLYLTMLYYTSHSKAKKDNPTTSSSNILTGKNRNNSINSSWGSTNARKLFLDFWILRDSHCRCFPTIWFYFSWILFLLQKLSIV